MDVIWCEVCDTVLLRLELSTEARGMYTSAWKKISIYNITNDKDVPSTAASSAFTFIAIFDLIRCA